MAGIPLFLKSIKSNNFLGIIFIAALLFSACDEGGGGDCVRIQDDPDFLQDFVECPTDGLQIVCNRFDCVLSFPIDDPVPPPEQLVRINPRKCEAIDCFNMECGMKNPFTGEDLGSAVFSIEEFPGDGTFAGTAGNQDFTCSPVVE
ncbi:MAG TPA: hypothetical protein VFJ67_02495 [Thermodesulfobacteriota bacterium]|jgi:hypothetical protein|nr:hypothetical protein [Thermodesulfobacteriota bacterium]